MYICKSDCVNSYFGKLKKDTILKKDGVVVINNSQAEDMTTCGYLRKMTEDELKAIENKTESCQDVVNEKVNKEVMTKVVNTQPRKKGKSKGRKR